MSFAIIAGIFGLITTIFWLVIGWRAMKAHESLSESMSMLHLEVSRLRATLTPEENKRSGFQKLSE